MSAVPHSTSLQAAVFEPSTPIGADPLSNAQIPTAIPSQIDLLISLHLSLWPALTLAIQNAWGGSAQVSCDKRDWLSGAVSTMMQSQPSEIRDVEDLEEVLLQVMSDEFEVVVDDGSAEEVARAIWADVMKLRRGDEAGKEELGSLYRRWVERQGRKVEFTRGEDVDAETDGSDDDDDEEWNGFNDAGTGSGDVDMDEAPALVESRPKTKVEPEVDEEGFTKVVGKNRR